MKKYEDVLKQKFGFDKFREHQLDIIRNVIEGKKDVCVTMFTGAGKSLCYQFPAVYTGKIVLVISPLIALMNDQVMKMEELGISVCTLNSTVVNKMELKKEILNNKYRIVYMTPEFLIKQQEFLEKLYNQDLLTSICIDEAHCLSSWGADFRPDYQKLKCLKEWFPNLPILTLTATATKKVQDDITNILGLKKPVIFKTTFDRPNLIIKVLKKTTDSTKDLMMFVEQDEPTIIYCQTRKMTDDICEELKKKHIDCEAYHAGMNSTDREAVHEKFIKNEISCVVATVAFGMGIDATIRKVIHYGLPKDMESYYQEIGRAGRDGLESYCYLFYALSDMNNNNFFLNKIANVAYRNRMVQLALIMKNYIFSSECRRKYILEYFGEEYKQNNCKACDNCLKQKQVMTYNFANDALNIFNTLNLTNNSFGAGMIISILRGSNSKKVFPRYKKSELFGCGKSHSEAWWKLLIRILINNQYIKEKPISGGHSFTLTITSKAGEWMQISKAKPDTTLILPVPEDMISLLPTKKNKPSLKLSDNDDNNNNNKENNVLDNMSEEKPKKKSPIDLTYDLYQNQNKTITQISTDLGIKKMTVEEHIAKLYDKDYDIDVSKIGFNDLIYNLISKKVIELKFPKELKSIKDKLPHNVSYLHIKLALSKMKKNNITPENQIQNTNNNNNDNNDDNDYIVVEPKKKQINSNNNFEEFEKVNKLANIELMIMLQKTLSKNIEDEYLKLIKNKN
ncbi:DNA helicase ATP-dependent recq type [Fadolivirus algeromassiliense]|jgi:Werner syndrome ATP-dependent helicase|uniref:DNA helicase ATP-dependent recq type n=1 Tax=Fadolivirus FV1/VV64 TaxID=3070911 RepID=A0A7D3UVC6_9VIRU|nr:DNA helicase ATP-dependent recq type [Fadolivirus algeromassiliense]QKF94731.1 DNA helicase ATP-dependent recq type [Fadolivirus FV1/VV64]